MSRRIVASALGTVLAVGMFLLPGVAEARGKRGGCGQCGGPCGVATAGPMSAPCQSFETVERTVYVPQMVTERRVVNSVVCEPEVRQRTVTVMRRVPETRTINQDVTVMVPEQRTKTVQYTVKRPVWREVSQEYTVFVPHQVRHTGVRKVCRPVQVQETRTICRDAGHWEERPVMASYGCGGGNQGCGQGGYGCGKGGGYGCGAPAQYNGGCGVQRVWVSNVIREQVPVTVWRNQVMEEPYERMVTVKRPETRTRQIRVCEIVPEQMSREVTYTVNVPTRQTRSYNVTTVRCVPEERVINETVMVPRTVQREVDVQVCRMVPKQVVHRVPVYHGCPTGGAHGCY